MDLLSWFLSLDRNSQSAIIALSGLPFGVVIAIVYQFVRNPQSEDKTVDILLCSLLFWVLVGLAVVVIVIATPLFILALVAKAPKWIYDYQKRKVGRVV